VSQEDRTTRFDAVGTDPEGRRVGVEISKELMLPIEQFRQAQHFELQKRLSRPWNPFSDIERVIRHFVLSSGGSFDSQDSNLFQKPWAMMAFYTFGDLRTLPYCRQILNLVEQIEAIHVEAKFRRYAGSLYLEAATNEYRERLRIFALSKHRASMEHEVLEGRLRDLMLFDWNDPEKYSVKFEVRYLGESEVNPYDPTWIEPNWIMVEIAGSFFNGPDFLGRFLELGKEIFTAFNGTYGYIDFARNPYDLWSIHMGQLYMHYKELWNEAEAWTLQQRYCRERVKKAFWGNFLNKEHVRRLGGFTKLKEYVPYEIIEPLPQGGALLVASRHPADKEHPEVAKRITQLQSFLKPILMKMEPTPPRQPTPHPPA